MQIHLGKLIGSTLLVLCVNLIFACEASRYLESSVDSDDSLSIWRGQIFDEIQRFNDTVAVGALGGALAGAASGAAATGDITGVLIGAATGAVAGGTGGYLLAKQRQANTSAEVAKAINEDVLKTRNWVEGVSEPVRRLNTGRANEINNIRQRVTSGDLFDDAAEAEIALIERRMADDRRLINQVIGKADENQGVFIDALAKTQGVERDLFVSSSVINYKPRVIKSGSGGGASAVRGITSSGGEPRYATAGVNVRAGPSTTSKRIGTFSKGQRVGFLGDAGGGWARVAAGNGEGFVASRFLSMSRPAGAVGVGASTVDFSPPRVVETALADNDLARLYQSTADLKAEDRAFEREAAAELAAIRALSRGDPPSTPVPVFPWPPPQPSARFEIPQRVLSPGLSTLEDLEARLKDALTQAGYGDRSYYRLPTGTGFALVTELERIQPDGTPLPEPDRFFQGITGRRFDLGRYISELFFEPVGQYRLLVIVVSDQPFVFSESTITRSEANDILSSGANRLPIEALEQRVEKHQVDALFYEFSRKDDEALTQIPGNISALSHMTGSKLDSALALGLTP